MKAFFRRSWAAVCVAVVVVLGAAVALWQIAPPAQSRPTLGEAVTLWPQAQGLNSYHIQAEVLPRENRALALVDVSYTNREGAPMEELHFLLYANSFADASYGIFEPGDMNRAYPNGFSPGGIALDWVRAGDAALDYSISGSQNHVLTVNLPAALAPGDSVDIRLSCDIAIPDCRGRFGYGENTLSLANCFPILSVYNQGTWHDYPYGAIGDPFYSDAADYTAVVTAPAQYTLAGTSIVHSSRAGGSTRWEISAPARRDFALVLSDGFTALQGETSGGVEVYSYHLPGYEKSGQLALDTAMQALDYYEKRFGVYPYGAFSVVQADFFIGGMEYPGMTLIDTTLYEARGEAALKMVTAHETAHMWWYGIVGSDQVRELWLDEALTDYSTREFLLACGDEYDAATQFYREQGMAGYRAGHPGVVNAAAEDYPTSLHYSAWVYDRGAAVIKELEDLMGSEAFGRALRAYYSENRLGLARRDTFEHHMRREFQGDLTSWLDAAFTKE